MMLNNFGRGGNLCWRRRSRVKTRCPRFGLVFTRPGWVRVVQWVTGMVMGWAEHTITRILVSMILASCWRAMEQFAEYGGWDRPAVERRTISRIGRERAARWGGYRPVAVDDAKLHRTSAAVCGTCTFHESARAVRSTPDAISLGRGLG